MNNDTFFMSESLKERFDFNEEETEEEIEQFLCEIIFQDTFLYLPIEELSIGNENFLKFKVFDGENLSKILKEKILDINILASNNTIYSLNPDKINNFGLKKQNENFLVEIRFIT